MKQKLSVMNTSVFDFDEGDPKPYLAREGNLFKRFFNHGGTPYGKQEKRGKYMASSSRKKSKLTAKKLSKKKSQKIKTVLEASSNRSSSASDLIEADDSDSESNQERKRLEMRFGGVLGTLSLNTSREEDHVAEQCKEVVMHGEELVFLEQWHSFPTFIFTADGIVLKIGGADMGGAVKWALHEINSFRSCLDEEKGLALIELDLTEHGVRTFLQALGQSDSYWSCHTLSSLLSSDKSSWTEDMKEITSLSDGYKSIWRAPREDMIKLFQESVERITRRRQDLENQHLSVDCIAYDRNRAMSDNWFDLIFPTKEDHDAVTVTQYDFLLLNPDQFLSDTIIDFYIKYLQSLLSEEQNKRFYFYNSFFFRKLTEVDKNLQHGFEKRKSFFERVKRWTAKINIFEKDYLFIPIMQSAHWSLVIVCHPGSLSTGCQDACDSKAPMILHFDSLEGCHTFVEEPIRNYLMEAWNEKNAFNEDSESLSTLKFVAVKAPQQTNYSDCGLFLLHYVELFIKEVLHHDSIDFATDEWFNPEEASSKRAKIQSLIEQLKAEELADKPEKYLFHTPSNITGPDGAWTARGSGLFGEEYLKATNLLHGNMLDQGCSVLVSYPQQYQNNLQVCAHTKFGHYCLESGFDLSTARELQQCFYHGEKHVPNGKLMYCLLQQGADTHVQDTYMPNCTCEEENCVVHDFDRTSLHDSLEGTVCHENLEDFHTLNRDVAITSPDEFTEGPDNDASGLTMIGENSVFTKSDFIENNGVNARALFGFSLHYDGKRDSDMGTSTVQKFSLDERPYAHAFQSGSPNDGKQYTNDDSLAEQVARSKSKPNDSFVGARCGDLEPKIWLTDPIGDVTNSVGKEINSATNECSKDGLLQCEDETHGGVPTQRELLTERTNPLEVSDNSSPLVGERTGLDTPQYVSSEGLTPNAAEGNKGRKRGRGSRRSNVHELTPATRRVTRSTSKR